MQTQNVLCHALLLCLLVLTYGQEVHAQQNNLTPLPKRGFKHDEKLLWKYDKFKDKTFIIVANIKVFQESRFGDFLTLTAMFSYAGHQVKTPETVHLYLDSHSTSWKYLRRDPELLVIADGGRISLGEMRRVDSDVQVRQASVVTVEKLGCQVPFGTFQKLTEAQAVEMKLGNAEFQLKGKHMEALRDFVNRVAP